MKVSGNKMIQAYIIGNERKYNITKELINLLGKDLEIRQMWKVNNNEIGKKYYLKKYGKYILTFEKIGK